MKNKRLREEPPPSPLEPQQAKERNTFIRDNIALVKGLKAQGKTFDEMKEEASDFANNYPHLFIMVSSNEEYDEQTLQLMLNMIENMGKSKINQHDASVNVGTHLMKNYVKK